MSPSPDVMCWYAVLTLTRPSPSRSHSMAKQWATRVVVAFQSLCWCTAILLLLTRGLANLRDAAAPQGSTLGVGLIVVAVLMIVASPAILVARAYDRRGRRYASVVQLPDLGLPPRYEDIVSRAPSYSSLFGSEVPQQIYTAAVKILPPTTAAELTSTPATGH